MASLIDFDQRWKWLWVLTLSLGTATDFLLAVLLCIYLKVAQRSTGGNTSTSMAVNKISLWTMPFGERTDPNASYLARDILIPRSKLNGRVILREGRPQTQYFRGGQRDNVYSTAVTGVEIQVTKMVEIRKDPVYEYGII
ncbi:hypothetical protein D9613_011584 [Agrocybe pediades]|uniref:Uncharacterized protein n=1 Tax=Agrocybe pediades TaxID=84607 RepID=A0A8H4QW72_9AGAR|nr:hypothetical protein D9613_011584 [Agrocybe pediades]